MLERYLRENYNRVVAPTSYERASTTNDSFSALSLQLGQQTNNPTFEQKGCLQMKHQSQVCINRKTPLLSKLCDKRRFSEPNLKKSLKDLHRLVAGELPKNLGISKKCDCKKQDKDNADYFKNYKFPLSKNAKSDCEPTGKLKEYRHKRIQETTCEPIVPPQRQFQDGQQCCMPVVASRVKSLIKGLNDDSKKRSLNVCYQKDGNTVYDTYLLKLGEKSNSELEGHTIEIELKTPRTHIPNKMCTSQSQICENDLDQAFNDDICKKPKKRNIRKEKPEWNPYINFCFR